MLKEAFRLGLVGLSLTACYPEARAYTTPVGIVYQNGSENEPDVVAHEQCHWDHYQKEGVVFWWDYYMVPGADCAEELSCGATEEHPACQ